MGVFESFRTFPIVVTDLTPVAQEVMKHFERQGYEVKGEETITRGWDISLHKGKIFKTICGKKTALKIEIESMNSSTTAKAGVGIFGLQAIPTAIGLLLFWPIFITQIWGMVEQSKLDEEALGVIESNLKRYANMAGGDIPGVQEAKTEKSPFCTNCGQQLAGSVKFCPECGHKIGSL